MKAILLLNPSSGKSRSLGLQNIIEQKLSVNGIAFDLQITKSSEHLQQLVAKFGRQDGPYDCIIGMGGDSTQTIIVNELMKLDSRLPLAIIGAGSSDDVARHLGIMELDKIIFAIVQKKIIRMDLIRLSDDSGFYYYVLGQANIGLGAFVNPYVAGFYQRHAWVGRNQLLPGLIAIWQAYRQRAIPLDLRIVSEEKIISGRFDIALFSLIEYWSSGLSFAPRANVSDGLMDIVLVKEKSFFKMLQIAHLAKSSKHLLKDGVDYLQTKSLSISSPNDFTIQIDGDMVMNRDHSLKRFKNLELRIEPKAISVFGYNFL